MDSNYHIIHLSEINSTNDFAKELISKQFPVEFTVISCDYQTKGKGQHSNVWHSDKAKNLTFSLITYPTHIQIDNQFYLSKLISLGIIDYLESKKIECKIKWPNDIYYENKKICGILIENTISGTILKTAVIGIGININQTEFPKDLPNAVSLSGILKKQFNLNEELELLLNFLIMRYMNSHKINFTIINEAYHKHLYKINQPALFKDKNGIFEGTVCETLHDGRIIIETLDKKVNIYNFKELEFL
jgi:BirA family biotin operon repressor/biotin-[acetyl-CoA-carboxylase] ligase